MRVSYWTAVRDRYSELIRTEAALYGSMGRREYLLSRCWRICLVCMIVYDSLRVLKLNVSYILFMLHFEFQFCQPTVHKYRHLISFHKLRNQAKKVRGGSRTRRRHSCVVLFKEHSFLITSPLLVITSL